MAPKAFRSSMRVLPPSAWEGAGGIRGSTFSQNSSLTVQGLVRVIPITSLLLFFRKYQTYQTSNRFYRFSDKLLVSLPSSGVFFKSLLLTFVGLLVMGPRDLRAVAQPPQILPASLL